MEALSLTFFLKPSEQPLSGAYGTVWQEWKRRARVREYREESRVASGSTLFCFQSFIHLNNSSPPRGFTTNHWSPNALQENQTFTSVTDSSQVFAPHTQTSGSSSYVNVLTRKRPRGEIQPCAASSMFDLWRRLPRCEGSIRNIDSALSFLNRKSERSAGKSGKRDDRLLRSKLFLLIILHRRSGHSGL